jgi:formate--tetrahydrofolate ligase
MKEILTKFGIDTTSVEQFRENVYKINCEKTVSSNKKGKLIIVTSTTPNKYGIGKTTTSIKLTDSLNALGHKTLLCLREPSLGPVFGIKGGAIGFGDSVVEPSNDINLHFTGDFHAITAATNIIASVIDDHIFQGNQLKIKKVLFDRCLDVNDRFLRSITVGERESHFVITAASEMMAILVLSKNTTDLRNRIDNIIVGLDEDSNFIKLSSLHCTDAILICLKDAIKPNIVLTKKKSLAFIHLGPFANSSLGTNSVIATNYALSVADTVISEVGFGSDCGLEKFVDIISPQINAKAVVVLVTTIAGLKETSPLSTLEDGFNNLFFHYENIKQFGLTPVVCLNEFSSDSPKDVELFAKLSSKIKYTAISSDKPSPYLKPLSEVILELKDSDYKLVKSQQVSKDCAENANITSSKVFNAQITLKNTKSLNQASKALFAISPYTVWNNEKDPKIIITKEKVWGGAGLVQLYTKGIVVLPGINEQARLYKMKFKSSEDFEL